MSTSNLFDKLRHGSVDEAGKVTTKAPSGSRPAESSPTVLSPSAVAKELVEDSTADPDREGAKDASHKSSGGNESSKTASAVPEPAKNFSIPRRPSHSSDPLRRLAPECREYKDIVRMLKQSALEPSSAQAYTFQNVDLVQNPASTKALQDKRQEMRSNGYTNAEMAECYTFLRFDTARRAREICLEGLKVGLQAVSVLGDPSMGVYLSRFMDFASKNPPAPDSSGYLVVLQLIRGRVKAVSEQTGDVVQEPTPNFDCHVSKAQVQTDISSFTYTQVFQSSQYYVYEFGEIDMLPRPRQCCPFAMVEFHYGAGGNVASLAKLHANIGLPSTHQSSENGVSDPRQRRYSHVSQQRTSAPPSGELGVVVWKGPLNNKMKYLAHVKLLSFCGTELPTKLGSAINIKNKIGFSKLQTLLPSPIFTKGLPVPTRSRAEKHGNFWYFYCRLEAVKDAEGNFEKLKQFFSERSWAGVVEVEQLMKLYLLPTSSLTVKLGLTRPNQPLMLHGLLVWRHAAPLPVEIVSPPGEEAAVTRNGTVAASRTVGESLGNGAPVAVASMHGFSVVGSSGESVLTPTLLSDGRVGLLNGHEMLSGVATAQSSGLAGNDMPLAVQQQLDGSVGIQGLHVASPTAPILSPTAVVPLAAVAQLTANPYSAISHFSPISSLPMTTMMVSPTLPVHQQAVTGQSRTSVPTNARDPRMRGSVSEDPAQTGGHTWTPSADPRREDARGKTRGKNQASVPSLKALSESKAWPSPPSDLPPPPPPPAPAPTLPDPTPTAPAPRATKQSKNDAPGKKIQDKASETHAPVQPKVKEEKRREEKPAATAPTQATGKAVLVPMKDEELYDEVWEDLEVMLDKMKQGDEAVVGAAVEVGPSKHLELFFAEHSYSQRCAEDQTVAPAVPVGTGHTQLTVLDSSKDADVLLKFQNRVSPGNQSAGSSRMDISPNVSDESTSKLGIPPEIARLQREWEQLTSHDAAQAANSLTAPSPAPPALPPTTQNQPQLVDSSRSAGSHPPRPSQRAMWPANKSQEKKRTGGHARRSLSDDSSGSESVHLAKRAGGPRRHASPRMDDLYSPIESSSASSSDAPDAPVPERHRRNFSRCSSDSSEEEYYRSRSGRTEHIRHHGHRHRRRHSRTRHRRQSSSDQERDRRLHRSRRRSRSRSRSHSPPSSRHRRSDAPSRRRSRSSSRHRTRPTRHSSGSDDDSYCRRRQRRNMDNAPPAKQRAPPHRRSVSPAWRGQLVSALGASVAGSLGPPAPPPPPVPSRWDNGPDDEPVTASEPSTPVVSDNWTATLSSQQVVSDQWSTAVSNSGPTPSTPVTTSWSVLIPTTTVQHGVYVQANGTTDLHAAVSTAVISERVPLVDYPSPGTPEMGRSDSESSLTLAGPFVDSFGGVEAENKSSQKPSLPVWQQPLTLSTSAGMKSDRVSGAESASSLTREPLALPVRRRDSPSRRRPSRRSPSWSVSPPRRYHSPHKRRPSPVSSHGRHKRENRSASPPYYSHRSRRSKHTDRRDSRRDSSSSDGDDSRGTQRYPSGRRRRYDSPETEPRETKKTDNHSPRESDNDSQSLSHFTKLLPRLAELMTNGLDATIDDFEAAGVLSKGTIEQLREKGARGDGGMLAGEMSHLQTTEAENEILAQLALLEIQLGNIQSLINPQASSG